MMENSMKNTATKQGPKTQEPDTLPFIVSLEPEIISTSALEGSAALTLHKEELGKVAHIVIDLDPGDVAYIVIAQDEITSGPRFHAPPHAALMFDAAHKRFIL